MSLVPTSNSSTRRGACAPRYARPCPLKNGQKFATRAHLTLPLYHRETEALRECFVTIDDDTSRKASRSLRLFTLLPTKSGYMTSFVILSAMALMHMLRALGMEKLKADGRDMDKRAFWEKYFDLGCVKYTA